jgi:hypothetical protein
MKLIVLTNTSQSYVQTTLTPNLIMTQATLSNYYWTGAVRADRINTNQGFYFTGGDASYISAMTNANTTGALAFNVRQNSTVPQFATASPTTQWPFVCQMVNNLTATRTYGNTYLTLRWALKLTGPDNWALFSNPGKYNLFIQDVYVILNALTGVYPGDVTINKVNTTSNSFSIDHTLLLPPTVNYGLANASIYNFAANPLSYAPSWFLRVYNIIGASVTILTPLTNMAPPSPPAPPPPPLPPAPPPYSPGPVNNLAAQQVVLAQDLILTSAYVYNLGLSTIGTNTYTGAGYTGNSFTGRHLQQTTGNTYYTQFKTAIINAMTANPSVPPGTIVDVAQALQSAGCTSVTIGRKARTLLGRRLLQSCTVTVYTNLVFPSNVVKYQAAAIIADQLSNSTSNSYSNFLLLLAQNGVTSTGVITRDVTQQVATGALSIPGEDGGDGGVCLACFCSICLCRQSLSFCSSCWTKVASGYPILPAHHPVFLFVLRRCQCRHHHVPTSSL